MAPLKVKGVPLYQNLRDMPNFPPTLDATSRKARGIGLCGVFEGQNFICQSTNVKTGFLATGGIRTRDMGSLKKGAAP